MKLPDSWIKLQELLLDRYRAWINKRIPRSKSISLHQRNIFIFPSGLGLGYFLLVLLLWVTATNYVNSPGFVLTFLMLGVFVVCILHTYMNMSGLQFTALATDPVFCGDNTGLRVQIHSKPGAYHIAIKTGFSVDALQEFSLQPASEETLALHDVALRRGWHRPGRLLVETVFPLGIMRSWTWIDLDFEVLVYPVPLFRPLPIHGSASVEHGDHMVHRGRGDEFYGFREYAAGESATRIAWKQFAQGRGLLLRETATHADKNLWLDWHDLQGVDLEQRLSILCGWVIQANREALVYGLRLPGVEVAPASGLQHYHAVLQKLALYGGGA